MPPPKICNKTCFNCIPPNSNRKPSLLSTISNLPLFIIIQKHLRLSENIWDFQPLHFYWWFRSLCTCFYHGIFMTFNPWPTITPMIYFTLHIIQLSNDPWPFLPTLPFHQVVAPGCRCLRLCGTLPARGPVQSADQVRRQPPMRYTSPLPSLRQFSAQRVRWSSS